MIIFYHFKSDFDGIRAPKSLVFSIDTIKLATEAIFPNQIYQAKSTEPICTMGILKQICQTKYTRQNLPNLFYQTKCLNYKEPNTLKQINSIKPTEKIHLHKSTKTDPKNHFYRYLKYCPIPAWAELGPAPPQLVHFFSVKALIWPRYFYFSMSVQTSFGVVKCIFQLTTPLCGC